MGNMLKSWKDEKFYGKKVWVNVMVMWGKSDQKKNWWWCESVLQKEDDGDWMDERKVDNCTTTVWKKTIFYMMNRFVQTKRNQLSRQLHEIIHELEKNYARKKRRKKGKMHEMQWLIEWMNELMNVIWIKLNAHLT